MSLLKNRFNQKLFLATSLVVSCFAARSADADIIIPGDYKFRANAIVIEDDLEAPSLGLIDVGTQVTFSGIFNTEALDASRDRSDRVNQFTTRNAVIDFGLNITGDTASAIRLRPNRAGNLTFENNVNSDLFGVTAGNSSNLWVSSGDFADISSVTSSLFFQAGDSEGTAFSDATDGFDGLSALVYNPEAFDVFLVDLKNQDGDSLARFSVDTSSFNTSFVTAVPEPSSALLVALVGVAGIAYRKRSLEP